MKIPVPVNESQLKLKTAVSAVGAATTGGILKISLSASGTGTLNEERPSSRRLDLGNPPDEDEDG